MIIHVARQVDCLSALPCCHGAKDPLRIIVLVAPLPALESQLSSLLLQTRKSRPSWVIDVGGLETPRRLSPLPLAYC